MHVKAIMHVVHDLKHVSRKFEVNAKIVHLSWRGNIRFIHVGMHVSTHEEKNSDL